MAKREAVERFRLVASKEFAAGELGEAVASLTRLGFEDVKFELITDVIRFNKNVKTEGGATEFLRQWISDHPAFKSREAVEHFRENDMAGANAHYALRKLLEDGTLKKTGAAAYALASSKEGAAGGPTKKKSKKIGRPPTGTTPGADLILSYAREHNGNLATPALIDIFEKGGRARGSVYATVNKLLTNKYIKRIGKVGSGEYELTKKGADAAFRLRLALADEPTETTETTTTETLEEANHGEI